MAFSLRLIIKIQNYIDKIVVNRLKQIDKFKSYYLMHETWLELYMNNIKIADNLKKQGINKIAIYGYGKIGKNLYKEISKSDIEVCYIIDKQAKKLIGDIPVLDIQEELPKVDAVIVTIPEQYDKIRQELKKICIYKIIYLEEFIYSCCKEE